MEKIIELQSVLDSKEVNDLNDDIDFFPAVKESKIFLEKINKNRIIALLPIEKQERLISLIDKIEDCVKSYLAVKNNYLCLAINHYISDGYDVLFSSIEDFEGEYINKLNDIDNKISKMAEDLDSRNSDFEKFISYLNTSKGVADRKVHHIEEQLGNAMNIITQWSNTVKKDSDAQITAKRKQIDADINIYKEEVKADITKYKEEVEVNKEEVQAKFGELLKGFEEFKENQMNAFEKVDERRKEFIDMYEIGVKYSKDARFDEYSEKEKDIADIFRWISLSLMVLVVLAITYLTYETTKPSALSGNNITLSMFSILSRFLLVFSLMIPAIYASRESSRHRRNSDKYVQMGNELRAFEIAIRTEDMRQETKERIKEEIFKRYFGNIFADSSVDKSISDDMLDAMRSLQPPTKQKEKSSK